MIDKYKLFLGEDPATIELFTDQVSKALDPFLKLWWHGVNPVPNRDEVEKARREFAHRIHEAPEEFKPLFECLERLFVGWRFNRRNFVNIHPSPLLPPTIASLIVSIQNPNNIVPAVSEATTEMEEECIDFFVDPTSTFFTANCIRVL